MLEDNATSKNKNNFGLLLFLLVAADIAFIIVDIVSRATGKAKNELFLLSEDRGYAEIYQYVKEFWIILLFATLLWRYRSRIYMALSAIYTYIMIDDSFQIHERGGRYLVKQIGLSGVMGLRAQDTGEIIVHGLAGLASIISVIILHPGNSNDTKTVAKDIFLLTALFVVFGAFFDMLDIMIKEYHLKAFMQIVEDGGEMLTISLTCWYALNVTLNDGKSTVRIRQTVAGFILGGNYRHKKLSNPRPRQGEAA
jgi:hypothetical protein